jgi:phage tail sheath protein FI
MSFLHGSETIEIKKGAVPVTVVKAAVIGLIGTAPKGPLNTPTLVLSDADAAQFGAELPGFSIPKALSAIFAQGAGTVIVINVFDPSTMTAAVTAEAQTIANGKIVPTFPIVSNLVVKNSAGVTTYVLGTDYTVDDYNNITVMGATLVNGVSVKIDYKKMDSSTVTAAVMIGAVDGSTGARTGMKNFDLCYNLFGFNPRIFLAPSYIALTGVAAELGTYRDKYKGFMLIDAPVGTTPANAITGRGPSGAIQFNTSSKRDVCLYPMLQAYDKATNAAENRPYSIFFAGLWAAVVANEGMHVSPSNHQINGITGVERNISASVDDPNAETNLLNAAGITTQFNAFGTGIRAWGNRSAAYPSSTSTRDVFLPVQMTASVIDESIRYSMLQFIDKPADQAWIDSVVESVNLFLRTLVSRGSLIDGLCWFDLAKNPTVEIAAGHFTFSYSFASPTPGERMTFESFYDINLFKSLK